MNKTWRLAAVLAVWIGADWATLCSAQDGMLAARAGAEAVAGSGAATARKKPTTLRMHVQLMAKGETLEAALAKLHQRRQAAKAQIETLGADAKSVTVGDPTLSAAEMQTRAQMERMIRERMAATGRKPAGLKLPRTVTVTALLKAEWPLSGDEPEKLLVAAHKLQEKIKAADLAGAKEATQLSPEEEELAEEMAQSSGHFGEEEEVEPGTPQFLFVAKISEAERREVLAKAFQRAKDQAAQLAEAAGAELGPLVMLSGDPGAGGPDSSGWAYNPYDDYGRRNYMRRLMAMQAAQQEDEEGAQVLEAVGPEPGMLSYGVQVNAVFGLKKK